MVEEMDREIIGAANIYVRAMRWKHLPAAMSFERFIAAIRRGDDPYLAPRARARPSLDRKDPPVIGRSQP